jgi:hypothetical protein
MRVEDLPWNTSDYKPDTKPCNNPPPRAIYDVLHMCELKGLEIPKCVDDWWDEEAEQNEVEETDSEEENED